MSDPDAAAFARSLAFLLSQTGARSAQLFARRLVAIGVSPRAFGVMANLQMAGTRTQQELADALGIHRNNMVGLIDELESAGWVERHRSHVDRRAFDIHLTSAGAAIVSRVNGFVPALDDDLARDLSPRQRQTLSRLLLRVADTLDLAPGVHPRLATRSR